MRIFKLQVLHWDQIIYGILKLKFHLRKLAGGRFEFTTGHRDEPTCPSSLFLLSPRPSHAGYDPKRTWGTLKFIIANDKSSKKIALRQPIAVVA